MQQQFEDVEIEKPKTELQEAAENDLK